MNDLVQHNQGGGSLSVQEMVQQVNQIQKLMKEVMKVDVHYGKIPGTPKNSLFKAGAEKIGMMFGCRTSFEINRTDMPDGHREYEVVCRITDREGNPIGEGVGTCTTMEKKYRYRSENTGAIVPNEYWDSGKDQSILGGPDFVPRKVNGKWFIHQQVDYDNPADYYNVALKMGKKRAYVDAIITCTAASDFFDQEEVIDTPELYPDHGGESPAEEPRKAPKAKATPKGSGGTITQGQARIVRKSMEDKSLDDKHICNEFGVKSIEEIPSAKINAVLEWIDSASG